MKNFVFAVVGLIIVLLAVFLFTRRGSSDDTLIPEQLSVSTPSPDLGEVNLGEAQGEKLNLPFELLNKEQIEGKTVKFSTTKGLILIKLSSDSPIASSNFIHLINKKFYDGVTFHRVIKGFMIQGGDPKGDGTGGPGYQFPDEPVKTPYTRGTLAMANAGPNTNGSQFFIMHQDYQLPPSYTIFGSVISGIEVVDEIANSEVDENDKPIDTITINTVILE